MDHNLITVIKETAEKNEKKFHQKNKMYNISMRFFLKLKKHASKPYEMEQRRLNSARKLTKRQSK